LERVVKWRRLYLCRQHVGELSDPVYLVLQPHVHGGT